MKLKIRRITLILIGLILIDVVLFLYYFFPTLNFLIRTSSFPNFNLRKRIYYDLYDSNTTDIHSKIYNLSPGDILITETDFEKASFGSVWLYGYINEKPFLDLKTGYVIFKIKYIGSKNSVIVNTILGANNYYINTLTARKGKIEKVLWSAKTVSSIEPLLKKGDPIIVNLYYSNDLNLLNNRADCDAKCKDSWKIVKDNYLNTSKLIKALLNNKTDNISFVGPIKEMIIYNEN